MINWLKHHIVDMFGFAFLLTVSTLSMLAVKDMHDSDARKIGVPLLAIGIIMSWMIVLLQYSKPHGPSTDGKE